MLFSCCIFVFEITTPAPPPPPIHTHTRTHHFTSLVSIFSSPHPLSPFSSYSACTSFIKVVGRKGIFGSTAERFREQSSVLNPGPGAYEEMTAKPVRRVKGRQTGAVFASTTARDLKGMSTTTEVPPPGSYEVQDQFKSKYGGAMYGGQKRAFISSGPRLSTEKVLAAAVDSPGPGTYNPGSFAHQFRPNEKAGQKQRFISTERRFNEREKFNVPGPGTYEGGEVDSSFLKRSYNVTIEGTI
uniref:Uncharacterized protein n=1 Tax=Palpitomonas bilix TaxID=652834 RepID=A0A7S3GLU7_9EUKA